METEVYMLSIPLARHRAIVPRPRWTTADAVATGAHVTRTPRQHIADVVIAPTATHSPLRHNDAG
jgi:hypothetical protein